MAKKNCRKATTTTSNVRKVNRRPENVRLAQQLKNDAYKGKILNNDNKVFDYDPKTESAVAYYAKIDGMDKIAVDMISVDKDVSNERVMSYGHGVAAGVHLFTGILPDGILAIRFGDGWTPGRVDRVSSCRAWSSYAALIIRENPGAVTVCDADDFGEEAGAKLDELVEWIADCGSCPDENGDIEVKLDSSAISRAVYNVFGREMILTFANGHTYEYEGVPRKRFVGLVNADSAGRFFNAVIRDSYAYQRVA